MAYNKEIDNIPVRSITQGLAYFTKEHQFKNEKEFTKSLLGQIQPLIKQVYDYDIIDVQLERLFNLKFAELPSMRIDILCTTKQDINLMIECKNPTNKYGELNLSLGQMLNYQMICENIKGNYKLIFASSLYHFYMLKVIKRFGLTHDVLLHNKLTSAIILNSDL